MAVIDSAAFKYRLRMKTFSVLGAVIAGFSLKNGRFSPAPPTISHITSRIHLFHVLYFAAFSALARTGAHGSCAAGNPLRIPCAAGAAHLRLVLPRVRMVVYGGKRPALGIEGRYCNEETADLYERVWEGEHTRAAVQAA